MHTLKYIYLFVSLSLVFFTGCNKKNPAGFVEVKKIVDGDTYHIIYDGREESVRLIGIDTPESRRNAKAKKDASRSGDDLDKIVEMGKSATEFAKSIVKPGDQLRIELDVQERDKYGRLLVYLYFPDGRMLNEILVKEGYASPLTYPPNVKYQTRFSDAYTYARENYKGLWGN